VTVEYEAQLALERIRREPAAYDLLLSDQTMPRMTGGQLATEVMALRPDLPVIMMTGYSTSMDEKRARELGIRTYLRKPLRGDLLLAAIRRLLDPQV
jgi:CheY-like chemotaxis protein